MKIHTVEQRSAAWYGLRARIPTASEVGGIVTGTGKISASGRGIARVKAAGLMGVLVEEFDTFDMKRGRELEAEARDIYQEDCGVEVQEVGFITDDAGTVGCSPDGLVGEDGGLEIKSLKLSNFLEVLDKGECPTKNIPQVQCCLSITGRNWWDFVAYHPGLPLFVVRVLPDLEYHAMLKIQVAKLIEIRDKFLAEKLNPVPF